MHRCKVMYTVVTSSAGATTYMRRLFKNALGGVLTLRAAEALSTASRKSAASGTARHVLRISRTVVVMFSAGERHALAF